jgi:hypothetical protein
VARQGRLPHERLPHKRLPHEDGRCTRTSLHEDVARTRTSRAPRSATQRRFAVRATRCAAERPALDGWSTEPHARITDAAHRARAWRREQRSSSSNAARPTGLAQPRWSPSLDQGGVTKDLVRARVADHASLAPRLGVTTSTSPSPARQRVHPPGPGERRRHDLDLSPECAPPTSAPSSPPSVSPAGSTEQATSESIENARARRRMTWSFLVRVRDTLQQARGHT